MIEALASAAEITLLDLITNTVLEWKTRYRSDCLSGSKATWYDVVLASANSSDLIFTPFGLIVFIVHMSVEYLCISLLVK